MPHAATADETAIRGLIEQWAATVWARDLAGVIADDARDGVGPAMGDS